MKTLGMGVWATATLPVATAKHPAGQAKTVHLDTGGMPALKNAIVTRKDAENHIIEMGGIVPPEGDDTTYLVSLLDD